MVVKWGNILSDPFSVSNGVKQGGILSPKLFNMYIDHLSIELNKLYVGCCVVNHLYYADDLCLLSPTAYSLNELLSVTEHFAKKNDIVFNEGKSVCLYFKPKYFHLKPVARFCINNEYIRTDRMCKYLGHNIITDDLSDNDDIRRQLQSLYVKCNMLLRTFGACSPEVKRNLFQSYCGSMYTAHLWCKHIQKQIRYNFMKHIF